LQLSKWKEQYGWQTSQKLSFAVPQEILENVQEIHRPQQEGMAQGETR